MELSDGRITTLVKDVKLPGESFVTTFGDKIFQTNHVNNSVACYTINGEKLWEFRDESVLRMPVGVGSFNNSFCTFGININDTYITRCGHCYSTVIDQGHITRMMW
jgi:hypothetical protein